MKKEETFELVFDKNFQQGNYIIGIDPYKENGSGSLSCMLRSKPIVQYGIKKVKGFNRVVKIGYSYIISKI